MEIKINIEGLNQLTEALALIGSALAYKNGMVGTSGAAVNLLLDVTDKIEDITEEEKVKKEVIKEVIKEVVKEEVKEVKEEEIREEVKVADGPPGLTIEQIREVFMSKNSKQNTPKLKKILEDHGVSKVTDLEEKDFQSVLKALEEI